MSECGEMGMQFSLVTNLLAYGHSTRNSLRYKDVSVEIMALAKVKPFAIEQVRRLCTQNLDYLSSHEIVAFVAPLALAFYSNLLKPIVL